jgi:methyl-accepting chemotaxis protein
MDWEMQSSSLRVDIERSDFMDFGIVDRAGQARYIKEDTTADLHDRDYIIQALSGKQAISDVLISRVINRPVIMYAVPITAYDSANAPVLGALIGRKAGDRLGEISKQVTYGKSGYAFLVSKTGTIIAHPDASLVLEQFNPIAAGAQDPQYRSFGDAVQTAVMGGKGIVEFMYKGKKLVAGYNAMPDFKWTLLVTVDYAEYMVGATRARNFVILMVLVCFIVGVSASISLPCPLPSLYKNWTEQPMPLPGWSSTYP